MASSDVDDLDVTLRRLHAAVTSIAAALLDLEAAPGRALLDSTNLTGRSASVTAETLGQLGQAWRAYAALKSIVEQATVIRGQRMDARRRAALDALLNGYSVPEVLSSSRFRSRAVAGSLPPGTAAPRPPAPRPGAVPARSPRTATAMRPDGWVKPEVLARRLDRTLGDVSAIARWFSDTCTEQLAVLSAAREEISELAVAARRLGEVDDRALAIAQRLQARTAAAAAADPIGVPDRTFARLDAALAAARSGLADLARRHDGLADDLADAGELLTEIIQMAEVSQRDADRAQVRAPTAKGLLRLADGWLDDPRRGLAPWLQRLRDQAADGRWKEASRGLAGWRNVAEATRTTAAQVAVTNAATLRRRDDLHGRFGAWEAKARRFDVADDPELLAAARRTRMALSQAPADVTAAQHHLNGYVRRLAALTGHRAPPRPTREPVGATTSGTGVTGGTGGTCPLPPPAGSPPTPGSLTTTPRSPSPRPR